jgi:vitellogenic carboxypeptidase-like protein
LDSISELNPPYFPTKKDIYMNKKNDKIVNLPGLDHLEGIQYAGYASIYGKENPKPDGTKDEELFYWFVGATDYEYRPTVIWTNGGPGSSSFWGFFLENGPYEIKGTKDKPKLIPREHAWNNYVNYMIFEHPLSVTLSFQNQDSDLPQNVEQGIEQYYQALVNFIAKHPEFANNPIILAGESYAGAYLPLLSKAILNGNKQEHGTHLNLRATILMDAWVNPMVQMATDTAYAYNHGMITKAQKEQLDQKYQHNFPLVNQAIQNICGLYMANIAELADPPFQPVLDYLNRDDVREAIHAKKGIKLTDSWSLQISNNYAFGVNDSYADIVLELLKENLQIIVVSGLNDAKDCNFLGVEAWLYLLDGSVVDNFKQAETTHWISEDSKQVLGYIQNGGVLSWVKILNAGHLAAMDQPKLINLFLGMSGLH